MEQCKKCGKVIVPKYKSWKGKRRYCSDKCRIAATYVEHECLQCGDKYKIARSRYATGYLEYKVCSNSCYIALKKDRNDRLIEKNSHICSNCGIGFIAERHGKTGRAYCSQECSKAHMKGENSFAYIEGASFNQGYRCIRVGDGYLLEHRLIMEEKIGRKLKKGEVVHHKDCNRQNNNMDNLLLMTKKEHDKLHTEMRKCQDK